MSEVKNVIKQLSEKDFTFIYDSLLVSNAEKSAYLMKALRERSVSKKRIMTELKITRNAYYTLRFRLNLKIEEYLMQHLESPRADVLHKVANINEIIFTKKRSIAIATLKKLEKDLIDYDLSNELTIVYKSLKKLHVNSPDYFQYSQLYNRHVAYMLALDKAEDLLADYFKKYGIFLFTGDETEKSGLSLLLKEMQNVSNLYKSHRLYVYQSIMYIFHRLFVNSDEILQYDTESIEDIFARIQKIFESYGLDSIYYHLNLVIEFLKLEYYSYYKIFRQAEKYFEKVNDAASNLLTNYGTFTFPSQFLITKLNRNLRLGTGAELYDEIDILFPDYEPDTLDIPRHVIFVTYKSLACYYAGKYDEAAQLINGLLNKMSPKKYPYTQLELKSLLAFYCVSLRDKELFNQLARSIQRHIGLYGKYACENLLLLIKFLKIAVSEVIPEKEKTKRIKAIIPKFAGITTPYFAPTLLIKLDEKLVSKLSEY